MRWISTLLVLVSIAPGQARAQEVLITSLDRFSPATPTFLRFSDTQWLAVGFPPTEALTRSSRSSPGWA